MALPNFQDPGLKGIYEKVAAGVRLDREDGLALFQSADLLGVGALAQMVRERLHGQSGLLHLQPAYQLLQHLHQWVQVLRLQPQGRGAGGL